MSANCMGDTRTGFGDLRATDSVVPPSIPVENCSLRPRWPMTTRSAVRAASQISDRLGQLQRLVDEGFRRSVERVTNLPAVQQEMRRIERSLRALEARITRLRMRGDGEPPAELPPGQDRTHS